MKKNYFLLLCFLLVNFSFGYSKNLIFAPLVANTFEPRIGTLYQTSSEKLRLDIGATLDLFRMQEDTGFAYSIGADFFTYTRLRSAGRFKFPVETSDYFFGANSSFKVRVLGSDFWGRFRIAHISSHLVDGYARDTVFLEPPFVYSKEFFDFVLAYQLEFLRVYVGSEIIFSYLPKDVNLVVPQLGVDFRRSIAPNLQLWGGYDLKLGGTNKVISMVHSCQLGIFINTFNDAGILISSYYFEGNSIHGMFYKRKDKYFAFGFEIIGL